MNKSPLILAVFAGTVAVTLAGAARAAFVEDGKVTLGLRNFYFDRNDKNTVDNRNEASEWGQGFILNYASGYTAGAVGFGVDAIGLLGVRLDGGGDGDLSDSRKPGQLFPLDSDGTAVHDYSKAGVTGKVKLSKTELRLGTLQPKLPVVTFNDGRLLPQLFEGGQISSGEIDNLTLVGGQLEHAKGRSSTDDVGLRIGGSSVDAESNKFYYAGGDYKLTKDLLAQYYFGNLEDYYEQHFLGLVHNWALPVGALKSDLRYFDSSSDGNNASADGRAEGYRSSGFWAAGDAHRFEVDNQTWSALFTYTLGSHALSAGYQQLSGDSAFPFLNQGDGASTYLITDVQINKFASAGERTWEAGYAYDFAGLGVPGLKASALYLSGDHIDAANGDRQEWERDLRLDYSLQAGALKGLTFTWRNASLRGDAQTDQDENRLIVSYSLPLL